MHRSIPHRARKSLHQAAARLEVLEPRQLLSFTAPVDGAQVNTNLGSFFIQLFNDQSSTTNPYTPNTVNNFLSYVTNGQYNGTVIHRTTKRAASFQGDANTKLVFDATAGTITRDTGSFITEGFQPNEAFTIVGTGTANDNTFGIQSISADGKTITIIPTSGTLTTQMITDSSNVNFGVGIAVIQGGGFHVFNSSSGNQTLQPLSSFIGDTNDSLTFAAPTNFVGSSADKLTFASNSIAADSITRSSGSFLADGFVAGDGVLITGTTNNNGKVVHIANVTDSTITLKETTNALVDETVNDSSSVQLTSGLTRTLGSFVNDAFVPGQTVTIGGTISNDGAHTIATVFPQLITFTTSLTQQTIADSSMVTMDATLPNVANEASGNSVPSTINSAFTVAMAQVPGIDTSQNPPVPIPGGGPDSASDQWFVNVTDNTTLDTNNPTTNSGPFVTFGRVIFGQKVVVAIDALNSFDLSGSLGGNAAEMPITTRNQFVNIASVEHLQLMTVTLGQGQSENALTYTDGDGTHTTLVVKQGTATITLVGTNLAGVSSGGVVNVSGTVSSLDEVALTNTSAATSLTSTSFGGNKASDIQDFTATGPVGTIDLKSMDLIGTYTTTANAASWTGPSHSSDEKQVVPASLTVSPAKTVAYQFQLPAKIVQRGRSLNITGSNTDGTNPRHIEGIFNIDATGTNTATRLTVHAAGRNRFVDIGGFTSDHAIDGVNARHTMNLTGPMIINGVVRRINLVGMSFATLSIAGDTKGHSLLLDSADNVDSNVFSNEPIRAIEIAGSWISQRPYPVDVVGDPAGNSSSFIQAPSIGRIIALGDFNADLKTSDPKTPLRSVFINRILGKCNWDIASDLGTLHALTIQTAFRAHVAGNMRSVTAGAVLSGNSIGTHTTLNVDGNLNSVVFDSTESGFGGTVGGNIRSLKIRDFGGSWSFNRLTSARFQTAGAKTKDPSNTAALLSNADFDPKKLSIGSIRIDGVADETSIQSNGSVGSISAENFTDRTTVMVGINPGGSNLNSLVDTPSAYLAHATLGSLTLTRPRPATYVNSLIDAWHMGRITIGTVTLQNIGVPFGLAANSIDSLTARGDNGQNLSFKNLDDPTALQQEISRRGLATQDFHIVLV